MFYVGAIYKYIYVHVCAHVHVYTYWGFPGGSVVKNPPAMQETQEMRVRSLGQEDPPEEGMTSHSGILAWRIPWTESGGLQFIGCKGT